MTFHEFAGSDHAFTHYLPARTARTAITMVGDHLRAAYDTSPGRRTGQPPRANA
ncbi:hypothetical protein [Lentzea sp. E54]|uniref:hypothetical protein n=1 Tax=Lentzea xerophila TaxID=3435883 RepID=UPI003DA5EAD5